ncbi:MAG: hypothetical protein FWF76_04980 [Oscillospiraceae bacterium]|nr:hypothetical protein [Oscillospiraceae bacterium]
MTNNIKHLENEKIVNNITGIFSQTELNVLKELGFSPETLVYTKRSFLPFIKPKQLVCRLKLTNGLYSFVLPEKAPKKFRHEIELIGKRLLAINNSHIRKLMLDAKKNAEFVERFNKELFFKHSFYKGKRISTAELFDFYETHPYYLTINLSSDEDKIPFFCLYAMTFFASTLDDLFTVDGIFSMQPERHVDNAKKTAGNAVFNLILRNDKEEIQRTLTQMGETLIQISLPKINPDDIKSLSKNYTLLVGLSEIGRVFSSVMSNEIVLSANVFDAANKLSGYADYAILCNQIAVLTDLDDYRETSAYKRCIVKI